MLAALKMADSVWYFGYGSNMKSSVMISRGITPLSIKVGMVPTHILTFDIFGIPYTEPSFASIALLPRGKKTSEITEPCSLWETEKSPPPPVNGVLYQLRREDYLRLVLSEGSGVGYDEITVEVYLLETGSGETMRANEQPIMAQTLKAKYPWRPNRGPSQRYMVRPIYSFWSDGRKVLTANARDSSSMDARNTIFQSAIGNISRLFPSTESSPIRGQCSRPQGLPCFCFSGDG